MAWNSENVYPEMSFYIYVAEFTTLKYCILFLNDLPNIKLILFYNFWYLCHMREARVACFPQELAGNPARRAGWPASIWE